MFEPLLEFKTVFKRVLSWRLQSPLGKHSYIMVHKEV